MRRYMISRLLLVIPTLLGVSCVVFNMLQLIPGDPALIMARKAGAGVDLEVIRHRLGLDLPLHVQYWNFLRNAVQGDLGQAFIIDRPVTDILLGELPFTLRLALVAVFFILVIGLPLGILSALKVNTWADSASMTVAVAGVAMPDFWLAILFILIFAVRLGWFPIFDESDSLKVLLLPGFVLGFRSSAIIARMTRSALLEVLGEDYIRTARMKGLTERSIVMRHALKNALIPVVTVLGLHLAGLLAGSIVVEHVFARRGIGSLALDAILQRDYPLAQGTVLFVATVFVLMNVIVDFLYGYLDPRIRFDQ